LETLPFNKDTKDYLYTSISKFSQDTQLEDWDKMMQWEGGRNLSYPVYYLMTLEEMIVQKKEMTNQDNLDKENMAKLEFCQKFLTRNGFFFIENMYLALDKSNLETQVLKTKALTLLLRVISYLFSIKQFSLLKNQLKPATIDKLIHETLNIINSFIRTCYA
jgi:ubiquitin C-terminal hydrolase